MYIVRRTFKRTKAVDAEKRLCLKKLEDAIKQQEKLHQSRLEVLRNEIQHAPLKANLEIELLKVKIENEKNKNLI